MLSRQTLATTAALASSVLAQTAAPAPARGAEQQGVQPSSLVTGNSPDPVRDAMSFKTLIVNGRQIAVSTQTYSLRDPLQIKALDAGLEGLRLQSRNTELINTSSLLKTDSNPNVIACRKVGIVPFADAKGEVKGPGAEAPNWNLSKGQSAQLLEVCKQAGFCEPIVHAVNISRGQVVLTYKDTAGNRNAVVVDFLNKNTDLPIHNNGSGNLILKDGFDKIHPVMAQTLTGAVAEHAPVVVAPAAPGVQAAPVQSVSYNAINVDGRQAHVATQGHELNGPAIKQVLLDALATAPAGAGSKVATKLALMDEKNVVTAGNMFAGRAPHAEKILAYADSNGRIMLEAARNQKTWNIPLKELPGFEAAVNKVDGQGAYVRAIHAESGKFALVLNYKNGTQLAVPFDTGATTLDRNALIATLKKMSDQGFPPAPTAPVVTTPAVDPNDRSRLVAPPRDPTRGITVASIQGLTTTISNPKLEVVKYADGTQSYSGMATLNLNKAKGVQAQNLEVRMCLIDAQGNEIPVSGSFTEKDAKGNNLPFKAHSTQQGADIILVDSESPAFADRTTYWSINSGSKNMGTPVAMRFKVHNTATHEEVNVDSNQITATTTTSTQNNPNSSLTPTPASVVSTVNLEQRPGETAEQRYSRISALTESERTMIASGILSQYNADFQHYGIEKGSLGTIVLNRAPIAKADADNALADLKAAMLIPADKEVVIREHRLVGGVKTGGIFGIGASDHNPKDGDLINGIPFKKGGFTRFDIIAKSEEKADKPTVIATVEKPFHASDATTLWDTKKVAEVRK